MALATADTVSRGLLPGLAWLAATAGEHSTIRAMAALAACFLMRLAEMITCTFVDGVLWRDVSGSGAGMT